MNSNFPQNDSCTAKVVQKLFETKVMGTFCQKKICCLPTNLNNRYLRYFYIIQRQTILTQLDLLNYYVFTANCHFIYRCQNGGSCYTWLSSYKCACAPGFYGDHCQNSKFLALQHYRKTYFNRKISFIMLSMLLIPTIKYMTYCIINCTDHPLKLLHITYQVIQKIILDKLACYADS